MSPDEPIAELAALIDHALLHPTLTEAELRDGCALARRYGVASVCIKPYAVPLAHTLLAGSGVRVGTVVGFPSGAHATPIKVAETLQACRDGAVEIDMVVNLGDVLDQRWEAVETEIQAINDACRAEGAILKVIFETDYLPADSFIIELCRICTRVGVAFVKTSTGFGFVRGADGRYGYVGATEPHLRLMLDHVGPGVGVKASGGVRTLDGLLALKALGVTRLGTSATAAILDEARQRAGRHPLSEPTPTTTGY